MIRVLVVAQQNETAQSIAEALGGEEMLSAAVADRAQALEQLDHNPPDAVVLAMGPQGQLSEEFCREVCKRTLAPVLVVGRPEQALDVERVLAAGADAHVLVPFADQVLAAQLWALLRRVGLVVHANGV